MATEAEAPKKKKDPRNRGSKWGSTQIVKRSDEGKFLPGHCGGPSGIGGGRVRAWRNAFYRAVTADDLESIIKVLVDQAVRGEEWAIHELLDRTLGKAGAMLDAVERSQQPAVVQVNVSLGESMRQIASTPTCPGVPALPPIEGMIVEPDSEPGGLVSGEPADH